jgi:hypothetical protein
VGILCPGSCWSDGKDSFLCDPANADISILEGSTLHQIVAVLRGPVPRDIA